MCTTQTAYCGPVIRAGKRGHRHVCKRADASTAGSHMKVRATTWFKRAHFCLCYSHCNWKRNPRTGATTRRSHCSLPPEIPQAQPPMDKYPPPPHLIASKPCPTHTPHPHWHTGRMALARSKELRTLGTAPAGEERPEGESTLP